MTALARHSDPATSREAAAGIKPRATALEGLVLATLASHGPSTTHRLAELTGLSLVTISPRPAPLQRRGFVEKHGRDAGRTVWRITAAGRRAIGLSVESPVQLMLLR